MVTLWRSAEKVIIQTNLAKKDPSRKGKRIVLLNRNPILLTSWATNAIKVIHAISAAKSYHLNERRKPSEYALNWMCACDFKCIYCFLMNCRYMDFHIDTRMSNDSFSQYHFFKTRMQIYIYLYESCMQENWFAFTLGLKYIVVQSIDHLVILGNWSTRVWINVYLKWYFVKEIKQHYHTCLYILILSQSRWV